MRVKLDCTRQINNDKHKNGKTCRGARPCTGPGWVQRLGRSPGTGTDDRPVRITRQYTRALRVKYSLCVSNFLMMVSMTVVRWVTCPRRIGMP